MVLSSKMIRELSEEEEPKRLKAIHVDNFKNEIIFSNGMENIISIV